MTIKTLFAPVFAKLKDKADNQAIDYALTTILEYINNIGTSLKYFLTHIPTFKGGFALVSDKNGNVSESTTTTVQVQYLNLATGTTGTGFLVLNDSPTFTTEVILPAFVLIGTSTRNNSSNIVEASSVGAKGIAFYNYSGTVSNTFALKFIKSHSGTINTNVTTVNNDILGSIAFYGKDGQTSPTSAQAIGITTTQVGAAGGSGTTPGFIPAKLEISVTPGGTTGLSVAFTIDPNGNIYPGNSALATNATNGFTYIETCAGPPTGVPAALPTGRVPMVYDTTNNKLYIYNGGWKTTTVFA
jgi:hypothetical protein